MSRNSDYQAYVQEQMSAMVGQKLSRAAAWDMYRKCMYLALDFMLALPADEQLLSLPTIGRFEILKSDRVNALTKSKGFTPRFKFFPCLGMNRQVLEAYGITSPEEEEPSPAPPSPIDEVRPLRRIQKESVDLIDDIF